MNNSIVQLINVTPFAMPTIILAARTCKNSVGKSDSDIVHVMAGKPLEELNLKYDIGPKDTRLIETCIKEGHESIFEHVSLTFKVWFSRAAQAQLLRHRVASYSAESSRYVEITDALEDRFFIPNTIRCSDMQGKFWDQMGAALNFYKDLIRSGIPIEDARYVLPLALVQPVMVTMNLREFRHVIRERTCKHAQDELRIVAKEFRRVIHNIHPLFVDRAEKYYTCCHATECGVCVTNWEGIAYPPESKEPPVWSGNSLNEKSR